MEILEEVLGNYPQIRVIDYLLTTPFIEHTKQQIAVGSEISRMTLNKFFDNLLYNGLIIKNENSKYSVNLKSPIIIQMNRLLDEINKIDYEKQLQYNVNEREEYNDDELEEIFNPELYDKDIDEIENEIIAKEQNDKSIVNNIHNFKFAITTS